MLCQGRLNGPNFPNCSALRVPSPRRLATLCPMSDEDADNTDNAASLITAVGGAPGLKREGTRASLAGILCPAGAGRHVGPTGHESARRAPEAALPHGLLRGAAPPDPQTLNHALGGMIGSSRYASCPPPACKVTWPPKISGGRSSGSLWVIPPVPRDEK